MQLMGAEHEFWARFLTVPPKCTEKFSKNSKNIFWKKKCVGVGSILDLSYKKNQQNHLIFHKRDPIIIDRTQKPSLPGNQPGRWNLGSRGRVASNLKEFSKLTPPPPSQN